MGRGQTTREGSTELQVRREWVGGCCTGALALRQKADRSASSLTAGGWKEGSPALGPA